MSLRTRIMEDIAQAERPHRACTKVASPKEVATTERARAQFFHDMSWVGQRHIPRWNEKKLKASTSPLWLSWLN
ncbi:MAG: hypothetical protein U1D31_02395 [Patescibacteria group bacterium]|nr:hypothetical protein [Patescibacteria group bacterium]